MGSIFDVLGLPSPSDLWAANQSRDNATTAYNRQREMAQWIGSNQVQWRVNDLKAAGINPMLAAGGGLGGFAGAPMVPTAGQAVSNNPVNAGQARLLDAQIDNLNANSAAAHARAGKDTNTTPSADQFGRKYEADIKFTGASADSAEADADKAKATVNNLNADTENLKNKIKQFVEVDLPKGKLDLETSRQVQEFIIQFQRYQAANMRYQSQLTDFEGRLAGRADKTITALGDPAFYKEAFSNISGALGDIGGYMKTLGNKVLSMGDDAKAKLGKSIFDYFATSRQWAGLYTVDSPERRDFGSRK